MTMKHFFIHDVESFDASGFYTSTEQSHDVLSLATVSNHLLWFSLQTNLPKLCINLV